MFLVGGVLVAGCASKTERETIVLSPYELQAPSPEEEAKCTVETIGKGPEILGARAQIATLRIQGTKYRVRIFPLSEATKAQYIGREFILTIPLSFLKEAASGGHGQSFSIDLDLEKILRPVNAPGA